MQLAGSKKIIGDTLRAKNMPLEVENGNERIHSDMIRNIKGIYPNADKTAKEHLEALSMTRVC